MLRILVVDDETQITDILKTFLLKNGFEVIDTDRGDTAMEIIRGGEVIDAMVLDMKMPHFPGIEVIKCLKNSGRVLPVVILSGALGLEKGIEELRELGYSENDILYKPVDLFELLAKIKNKINQR